MSKVKFSQLADGVDVVKWSKGDGRVAICTSNFIYVLTPSPLSSASDGGRTTRQPPLAESFTVTVAELPTVRSKTDPSCSFPQKRVDAFCLETCRDGDLSCSGMVRLPPKSEAKVQSNGAGTFVGCEWCPLDNATGFLLCGLTSRGHLYLFEPPFTGLKAWKMVHSFSDALLAHAIQQSDSSKDSSGPPHHSKESPGPVHHPEESPGPTHTFQESPAAGPAQQLDKPPDSLSSTAHIKMKAYLQSEQSRAHMSQRDCAAVTAFAWQSGEANHTNARLAVGTRSGHVSVFDMTSHFTVTSDSLSTRVSEQLVCRGKVPILLSHRILCMAWTEEAVQESKECMLAIGCSDGSLHLMSTSPTAEVVVCPTQLTDSSAEVDEIPIHHLVWCPGHGQDGSRLLFSKGTAVGVATIGCRSLEVLAFVVGGHNLPIAGITQVHTAGGVHSLSIGMDGTAQLFDPWGAGSPAAGGGGLTVLQSEVVLLQHSPHPPKTLVRGVAASRNGVYFTTVISVQAFGWLEKVTTEVYFQSLLTPSDVEKDFCTPGSYLSPSWSTTPLSPATASASSVWDALHLLLGSATDELEEEEPSVLSHLQSVLEDSKRTPEMASLLHQIAYACGKEDIVDKADWVTTVTHIQSSLKDWLKQHKHSDRDPDTLRVLCVMAKWLQIQETTDITPAQEVMSEVSAAGVSEVDLQSRCAVCETDLPLVDSKSGRLEKACPQGHPIARCSLTLCVLSTPTGRQCCHCKAWAGFPSVDGGPWLKALLTRPVCLLCGGPFTCVT